MVVNSDEPAQIDRCAGNFFLSHCGLCDLVFSIVLALLVGGLKSCMKPPGSIFGTVLPNLIICHEMSPR